MKTFYAPTLLAILIIHHVLLQPTSASFQPDPGSVFSGRNRKLRKLPSPPPAPKLGQVPHYMFSAPPPPPSTTKTGSAAQNLRVVRKASPPAPMFNRPRNFRIFLSPPPPAPLPPPPPPPPPQSMPPNPPAVKGRYSNCKMPPPPPASS